MRFRLTQSEMTKNTRARLIVVAVACFLAVGAAAWVVVDTVRGPSGTGGLVPENIPRWASRASDFTLDAIRDGSTVRLADLLEEKPAVLVMSSFT